MIVVRKPLRIRWTGNVAFVRGKRSEYRVLVQKLE
jgi:hypothetical protein